MKVGVLGDVHGNSAALAIVLERARDAHVERLLVTGDLIGYYFAPAQVLELLEPWDACTVRGNHEDMLAAARADASVLPRITGAYGGGLETALRGLALSQLDTLCSLPHPLALEIDGKRVLLCHGSPWSNDAYVYPDADAQMLARCAVNGYDMVVMGHTHYPMLRRVDGVTLLNPGSVGQPRNRQPGAQWALFDTASGEIELRCEHYDFSAVAAEARMRHPELPFLSEVLERV